MSNRAWVTLATNDSYGLGALVLAHSLRRASSSYPAVVLITPSVTEPMRERLRAVFAEVIIVDVLDSRDAAHLALLQRPELGITFTKIHCWNLTQYEKCVFLDADTLIVQNCDELFEREQLSAAPDVGWPDCFNSGVFVFTPSADTFNELIAFAKERGSFDGGDQGLLNSFFSDWARGDINKHLPFLYNVTSAAFYSYLPALKQFGQDLKIIHFIGAAKPWLQQYNFESGTIDAPEHIRGLLQLWWDIFVTQVHRQLDTGMVEVEKPSEAPEIPPNDVSHEYHYQPILDPQSEFAWHHPVIQNMVPQEKEIEITDYFDPWDIYRGNIPAKIDNESSYHSELGRVANQEEIRNYAWDYQHEKHNKQLDKQMQYTEQQGQQQQNIQTYHSDHLYQNYSQHDTHHVDQHWHYSKPHDNQTHHFDHQKQHYSQHHNNQPNTEHWQYHHQVQHNQLHDVDHHVQHFSQQHNKQEYHTDHHWKPDLPQANETHYTDNIWQYNPQEHHNQTDNHWQHQYHNQASDDKFHEESNPQQTENQIYDTDHCENAFLLPENHQQHQYVNASNHDHNEYHSNNQYSHIHIHNSDHHNDNFTYTYPQNQSKYTENNYKDDTINENISVNCVQVEVQAEKGKRRKRIPHPIDVYGNNDSAINGDISESESDIYDEIIPRHPYDDFYLRHRVTIDARGRKICSHEIPPTPTPSPPNSPLPINTYDDKKDEFSPTNNFDIHSGVAGNLARVMPGTAGQHEALDELTRRQGWEAGNIDYMGADSFDNIWAKISQTLSKPRASPPKQQSPPKEIAPTEPVTEEISVQSGVVAEEPVSEQVEEAKEAIPVESSAPTKEIPIPSETVEPVEVPVTVEKIESESVQETPSATEVSPPVQAPSPAETVIPLKAPVTEEVVSLVEAVAVETPANVEITPTPLSDIPVTVEATETEITTALEGVAPVASETGVKASADSVKVVEQPEQKTEIPLAEKTPLEPIVEPTAILAEPSEAELGPSTEVAAPATVATPDAITVEASAPAVPFVLPSSEAALALATEATDAPTAASVKTPATVTDKAPAVVGGETPVPDAPVLTETTIAPVAESVKAVTAVTAETPAAVTVETPAAVTVEAPAAATVETPAAATVEKSKAAADTTPEKSKLEADQAVTDSPPLVITPSKEEVSVVPSKEKVPVVPFKVEVPVVPSKEEEPVVASAKSEERRKPAGKLKLVPPAAADPLPTPDSELEDAATLAQSIIASELRTPTVTSPEPAAAPASSTSPPLAPSVTQSLSVEEPEVPTPPVGSVSLAQIGVKTTPKGKSTTAAQIASSIVEPLPSEAAAEAVAPAPAPATTDVPKKKVIKKVVKKETGATGADAPVPPPRKKEKKPKEK